MRFLVLFLSLCGAGLLSSCSIINYRSAYDANALNIPFHKAKNEIKGSAGYGSVLGFNGDVSYAATNNLAVKVSGNYNHQYLIRNRLFGPDHFDLKNHYLEGGLGYFKYFKHAEINSLEVSGGYGNGLVNKFAGDRFNGRFHKYFIQLNFGHTGDLFELGYGLRYTSLFYPGLRRTIYTDFANQTKEYQQLHIPGVEFSGIAAFGGKKLKATTQVGLAIPFKRRVIPYDPFDQNQPGSFINFYSAIFQVGIRYKFSVGTPALPTPD